MLELPKLARQKNYDGIEASAIFLLYSKYAQHRDQLITLDLGDTLPEGYVPFGSVEFVESFLKIRPTPDYLPTWTIPLVKRLHWINTNPAYFCYFKPADRYKRFDNILYTGQKDIPTPPYFVQERIVGKIVNEWRYYVANGKVLFSGWYAGLKDEVPAPEFPIPIPDTYIGAVDLAELDSKELTIVEAHHPYACGLYCSMNETDKVTNYVNWLHLGWQSLN